MENRENKVTPGEVVSSTRKYSNKDNTTRKYIICADVDIRNGKAVNFSNGSLITKDVPTSGSANFSKGENWFNFNANNLSEEDTKGAFDAVMEFIEDVTKDIESPSE